MKGVAYFSVNPPGVVKIVRQMYWHEGKQAEAIRTLLCFDGISGDQIDAILSGDATIDENCRFLSTDTSTFKSELTEFLLWLDSQFFIELAGRKVPKKLLAEYGGQIVSRLRNIVRRTINGAILPMEELVNVPDLEDKRRELHQQILKSVGLERGDDDYSDFQHALSEWLDKVAGSLLH